MRHVPWGRKGPGMGGTGVWVPGFGTGGWLRRGLPRRLGGLSQAWGAQLRGHGGLGASRPGEVRLTRQQRPVQGPREGCLWGPNPVVSTPAQGRGGQGGEHSHWGQSFRSP